MPDDATAADVGLPPVPEQAREAVADPMQPGVGQRLREIRDAGLTCRHRLVVVSTADLDWLLGFLP